jgi:phospholipid/cholesterol/gamma-HCH transport system permease protein
VNALLILPTTVGHWALRTTRAAGVLGLLFGRMLLATPKMRGREYLRGLSEFGLAAAPLALLTAAVTGAMVVLQTSLYTERFGARGYLGWAAGHAVLWQFGPLLLGLMMNARIGARNAAELASLQLGGQLEGLRGISLDPLAILIAPRIWSQVTAVLLLAGPSFLVAILAEVVAAWFTLTLPPRVFLENFAAMLGHRELLAGMIKLVGYAWAVALISTAIGLGTRGGARAVGRAAASSVVWGAFSIFALDFVISSLLVRYWSDA